MMRTVHVAAAVIKSDRGILACRRADTQGDDGWEFPGGKVEESESAEAPRDSGGAGLPPAAGLAL